MYGDAVPRTRTRTPASRIRSSLWLNTLNAVRFDGKIISIYNRMKIVYAVYSTMHQSYYPCPDTRGEADVDYPQYWISTELLCDSFPIKIVLVSAGRQF
jgi:hypothetical protein